MFLFKKLIQILNAYLTFPMTTLCSKFYLHKILSMEAKRKFITVKRKRQIADEARASGNIKDIAERHCVFPAQVRRWIKADYKLDGINAQQMTLHGGRLPKTEHETFTNMRERYDDLRERGRKVSTTLLLRTYRQNLQQDAVVLSNMAIRQRIYRWMVNERITSRRITHKAQNTRYVMDIENDFKAYIREQAKTHDIDPQYWVNIDETNIDFDIESGSTLADVGSRTVTAMYSGSNMRCTILLGVTASGDKLKPFIVWKGTENGRIKKKECHILNQASYHETQKKAWVDERVFKVWIDKIWKPFAEQCPGLSYLIMDRFKVQHTYSIYNIVQNTNNTVTLFFHLHIIQHTKAGASNILMVFLSSGFAIGPFIQINYLSELVGKTIGKSWPGNELSWQEPNDTAFCPIFNFDSFYRI